MTRCTARLAAALLVGLVAPALASAGVIGLPTATGQGTPGTADPNFQLVAAPLLTPTELALGAVIIDPGKVPGPWGLPGPAANWIGVIDDDARTAPGTPSDPWSLDWADAYVYRVEFDIVGNPATAEIEGTFASDNHAQIWVNGIYSGWETEGFVRNPFHLTEDFVAGPNVLEFRVRNFPGATPDAPFGNPTGLLVEQVTASGAVPEPATVLLLAVGLGTLALRRRR